MLIGTLRTFVLEKKVKETPTEGGYFELEITVPRKQIETSGSPRAFIINVVAQHLAAAVIHTGVPKHHWYIEFTNFIQKELNVPETMRFDIA